MTQTFTSENAETEPNLFDLSSKIAAGVKEIQLSSGKNITFLEGQELYFLKNPEIAKQYGRQYLWGSGFNAPAPDITSEVAAGVREILAAREVTTFEAARKLYFMRNPKKLQEYIDLPVTLAK